MRQSPRDVVVDALVVLSWSGDFQDRQDAGVALARFAELPVAARRLLGLVLDPEDTAVTRGTVDALVQRQDEVGLAIVAAALSGADDNQADWIQTGVDDGLQMSEDARREALASCASLRETHDTDAVRRGASLLKAMLDRLGPPAVLAPGATSTH